jgi:hypothetical protein
MSLTGYSTKTCAAIAGWVTALVLAVAAERPALASATSPFAISEVGGLPPVEAPLALREALGGSAELVRLAPPLRGSRWYARMAAQLRARRDGRSRAPWLAPTARAVAPAPLTHRVPPCAESPCGALERLNDHLILAARAGRLSVPPPPPTPHDLEAV